MPTTEEALAQCEREIQRAEAELRAGNREIAGLLLAIQDWTREAKRIREERCENQRKNYDIASIPSATNAAGRNASC